MRWVGCRRAGARIDLDPQRELQELKDYLGDEYQQDRLEHYQRTLDEEWAGCHDEDGFYRTSNAYLYNLTAFAMTGTKLPYLRELTQHVPPGSRLLDYGCGIGSDGLMLLKAGYKVEFADFDNPSTAFLRWRLQQQGFDAAVHDLDKEVPGGFDASYAFDVIEHVRDPWTFLERDGEAVRARPGEPARVRRARAGAPLRAADPRDAALRRRPWPRALPRALRQLAPDPLPAGARFGSAAARQSAEARLARASAGASAARQPCACCTWAPASGPGAGAASWRTSRTSRPSRYSRGHEVSYFFSGRQYPLARGPRLRRWDRDGMRMLEVVNSPLYDHGRQPELEVAEPRIERMLADVLAEVQPEVVHVQELAGLPFSVVGRDRAPRRAVRRDSPGLLPGLLDVQVDRRRRPRLHAPGDRSGLRRNRRRRAARPGADGRGHARAPRQEHARAAPLQQPVAERPVASHRRSASVRRRPAGARAVPLLRRRPRSSAAASTTSSGSTARTA